jgi:hypothetical protein
MVGVVVPPVMVTVLAKAGRLKPAEEGVRTTAD